MAVEFMAKREEILADRSQKSLKEQVTRYAHPSYVYTPMKHSD